MTKVFLNDGDSIEVKGSGKKPYLLRNVGGVVDCSCPAWRNIGGPLDLRVCKHIRANVDRACLLPQAHAMYDSKKAKPKKGGKGAPRKAAVKKDAAPPVLLAHKWENEDPTDWWMSEKLDGVRAWWTGERFLSRNGNEFHAPKWFKEQLPRGVVLDGELFAGRGNFTKTSGAARKLIPNDDEWNNITYVIFDAPEQGDAFEVRVEFLKGLFPVWEPGSKGGVARVLPHTRCKSAADLTRRVDKIVAEGGEGIMIRMPGSMYEEGKSNTCLKVKKWFDDEGVVVGYIDGKGQHKGRVGSIRLKWGNVETKVGGLTHKLRKNPPPLGSVITFRYTETFKETGVPRFPQFVAVRDYE